MSLLRSRAAPFSQDCIASRKSNCTCMHTYCAQANWVSGLGLGRIGQPAYSRYLRPPGRTTRSVRGLLDVFDSPTGNLHCDCLCMSGFVDGRTLQSLAFHFVYYHTADLLDTSSHHNSVRTSAHHIVYVQAHNWQFVTCSPSRRDLKCEQSAQCTLGGVLVWY